MAKSGFSSNDRHHHYLLLLLCLIFNLNDLLFTVSSEESKATIYDNNNFLHCLNSQQQKAPSNNILFPQTKNTSHYTSILKAYIRNARFNTSSTQKPSFIFTPLHQSHVQSALICAKSNKLRLRIRSGGHDYEGISYTSNEPFILIDLFNLRSVFVDIKNEVAVVQAGATLGEVYYKIWEKSKVHGFPSGLCPTVGVGGHFSGGGYGNMLRKFGLSVDHIVDAQIVDVKGRILNRKSMGEDLFWAIRGGGGASFGVILSYTVRLVQVPEIITVFRIQRTLEENATDLVVQWQHVAPHIDDRIFMRLLLQPVTVKGGSSKRKTVRVSVLCSFLGRADELVRILGKEFPVLGLRKQDCFEMNWIDSMMWWFGFDNGTKVDKLLDRNPDKAWFLKRKSDYVETPIPRDGLEAIWKKMIELGKTGFVFNPYGGKMNEIPSDATPFPHRAGNLFKIQYSINWYEPGDEAEKYYVSQIRQLYSYMTPFVSKNPRRAFINYRDLDVGINNFGKNSLEEGKVYGVKYFHNNYERLVKIKTEVDPENFFRNQQSIPVYPRLEESGAAKILQSSLYVILRVEAIHLLTCLLVLV